MSAEDPLSLIEFSIIEKKPNTSLLYAIIEENGKKLEQISVHLIVFGYQAKIAAPDFSWVIKTLLGSSDPDNPLLGKLLRSEFLSVDKIKYLIDSATFIDYQDCVTSLSYGPSDRIAERVLEELDIIFGPQSYNVYDRLISILQPPNYIAPTDMEIADFNRVVYSHILNRAKGISHYANVPKWVLKITKPSPDDIPTNDPKSKAIKLPDETEAANMIIDSIAGDIEGGCRSEDIVLMKATISATYSAAETDLKKLYILLPVYYLFLEQGKENVKNFRFFGPSNPIINSTGISNELCTRMLCDTSYFDRDIEEIDFLGDDREIGPLEWVEETCDKCNRKIRQYNHAVRMPKEGGGWLGCYCSFECVENDLIDPQNEAEMAVYEIRKYLISYFSIMINKIGVYDINDE